MCQVTTELADLFDRLRKLEPTGVRLATCVREIRNAKAKEGIAVVLGSQGAGFLGLDLNNLSFFAGLGIRTMQPAYQRRNQFADGCGEETDVELSRLGVQ